MLYQLSTIIIVFNVNFFQNTAERIYSPSLELSADLWYNDVNSLIRCGGFGGHNVACHGGYWCGFI